MRTTLEEAQANPTVVANRAEAYAHASRRAEKYEAGSKVVLTTRHLCVNEHLPLKLRRQWIGPFSIAKVTSLVAYRLNLPPTWGFIMFFMYPIWSGPINRRSSKGWSAYLYWYEFGCCHGGDCVDLRLYIHVSVPGHGFVHLGIFYILYITLSRLICSVSLV